MRNILLYLRTMILGITIATASTVVLSGCVAAGLGAAAALGAAGAVTFNKNFELKRRSHEVEKPKQAKVKQ